MATMAYVIVKPGEYRFTVCLVIVYFETMLAVHSFRIAISLVGLRSFTYYAPSIIEHLLG